MMNRTPLSTLLACLCLTPTVSAQVLVDWDFSSLVNPGVAGAPISVPLLDGTMANTAPALFCTGLTGERSQLSYQGLSWATANSAPGELNLRFFDGDLSDPAGTNNDGVSDNYLSFTLTPTLGALQVDRISVSAWRNASGAPGLYAMEVVVDGGAAIPFGATQTDTNTGDFGYDWFQFDDQVVATTSLEVRFRPVATAGGTGTGNLHINGLRVEAGTDGGEPTPEGPNVLFLIADDLTATALGCYGNPDVHTPNIDALAERGVVFDRAYCQYPVCAASRASMLTGLYPSRIQAAGGNFTQFDGAIGEHSTLPEHFRLQGYTTARVSKLYHMRIPGDITSGSAGPDHAASWDLTYNAQAPEWMTPGLASHYTNENLNFNQTQHYGLGFGTAFYAVKASTSGAEQADSLSAVAAMQMLDSLHEDPFFLAVGFVRPHVPLVAPDSIYDLYDPQALPLAGSVAGDLSDIPSQGISWNEPVRGPFNDEARHKVLQAYYSSVTFMDQQVGLVLDRLQSLELEDDTIVVFTSDHGYHLGEHTLWQKLSLHEESARVPMIIAGPGIDSARSDALAELLDLYPTLADMSGLPTPPKCQGLSLLPVLVDPSASVRSAAHSSVANGDALRTDEWAYLRYSNGTEELYDMRPEPLGDPLQFTNLADSSIHAGIKQGLSDLLDAKLIAAASDPGQAFCFGDGTSADCPCLAWGGAGEGCLTSSGSGATLTGGGSADMTSDSFTMTLTGGPPHQASLLFHGLAPTSMPLQSGILCAVPSMRYGVKFLDGEGCVEFEGLSAFAASGTTHYYQCFFRDVNGPCSGGFNSTNGWQVLWN